MNIQTLTLGPLATNCYLVRQDGCSRVVIIDPAANSKKLLAALQEQGLTLEAIFLTHAHFDHMLYARPWLERGAKLYVHELDAPALADPELNVSGVIGAKLTLPQADVLLREGDVIREAGLELTVLHTPGHTPGGVCYQVGDVLFSGDTMFYGSYGRVDLPGGNNMQMAMSLKRLLALPKETVAYPGHGMKTKIAWERGQYA